MKVYKGILRNRDYLSLSLFLLICVSLLISCGSRDKLGDQSKSEPQRKPRVALIMKSLANEFFKTMEEGARKHHIQNSEKYDLIVEGIKDELDINRQVQLVEMMMSRRVDAIVIAPADSKALVPVCKRAIDQGIVVINIDNKFDDEVLKQNNVKIPFVGPDNRKGAKMVGIYLAERLSPGDEVAVINGVPTAYNAIQRRLGFLDAINERGLKLVADENADWEMSRANQVVSALITEKPNIKGVFCANDSMALGAISALKSSGMLGKVMVVGFDNISAANELIQKGELLATADQHADLLAVYGIEYALKCLLENKTPDDMETPVDLIVKR
ncbi:MAG: sugar ABC transporter substrate-binding protein [Candidatus Hydrogenedentes bacterium]|nr:sugar ABC transporter substrate-binding protein [Candidatus Hydrogenedentota bacterium]